MGQVIVKFFGLCIYVHRSHIPELPAEHRVVLLSNPPLPKPLPLPVKPHHPELKFISPAPEIDLPCLESLGQGAFRLNGVRLQIANGSGSLVLHETFDRVPHLTPVGSPSLEADLDVILHGAPPAAAYFDFDAGTFSACLGTIPKEGKAAVGTTVIVDTGDNAPTLDLSCFGGQPSQVIELGPHPRLHITNVATEGPDDENDYLINYEIIRTTLTFVPPPPDPNIDGLIACDPDTLLDFGPPCSNSNYP